MARILVTGGTGVIGRALVTRLLADGEHVVGLARSEEAAAALAMQGVEVKRGEVYDEDALTDAMAGCSSFTTWPASTSSVSPSWSR